jgi:lysozyme
LTRAFFKGIVANILPTVRERETAMPTRTSGIDVSHYQGVVDWIKVKATGIVFAFTKATEGVSNTDAQFSTNWAGIRNAGLVRGAYHFFHPAQDPAAQADHFVQTVALSTGDLPPVLDVETADSASNSAVQSGVKTWLDTVAARTGVTPMIYASPGFWNGRFTGDFSSYPLWIAQYGVPAPKIPNGWTNWNFWQYSQSGKADGISGSVDLDYFQGSMDDLHAFLGSGAVPVTSPSSGGAPAPQTYTIQSGDTLGEIAVRFGVTVASLLSANNLSNPNLIQVGQVLQIPGS